MDDVRRALAVVATVAFVASACGGTHRANPKLASSSSSLSAPAHAPKLQATLLRAVHATRLAHTAHLSLSIGISGLVPGGANFSEAGTGVVDFSTEDTDLVLTSSLPGVPSTPTELRLVDSVMYVRSGTAPGTQWNRIDLRQQLGTSLAGLSSQSDPTQELAYLAAVSDDVRSVGREDVRGVTTTHYQATLDMAKALRQHKMARSLRARLAKLAPKLGTQRIPIEAWLDDQGRLRRVVLSYQLAPLLPASQAAGVAPDAEIHIQEDLFNFGTPVLVTPPPAAAIAG